MKAFRRVSLAQLRDDLNAHHHSQIVVLAGAGVSMAPPTLLPSGNSLRDMCVQSLLSDSRSSKIVARLVRAPAYQALLPEAVLQLIGSTVGKSLDTFMRRVLRLSAPNVVHHALVKSRYRLFTTNFDLCLEMAGGSHVHHLHGTIASPESLQNQLYRLGKTALFEGREFSLATRNRTLLVIGYSLQSKSSYI
jgi:hypothetical protein